MQQAGHCLVRGHRAYLPLHRLTSHIPASHDPISLLCPKCGLCCNGVLFADVKLLPADNSVQLAASGLSVLRGQGRCRFLQPCSCFDGVKCRIYAEKPGHCRDFDCFVLKRYRTAKLSGRAALARIRRARQLADQVHQTLQELGNQDARQALTRRYQAVMKQPIDLEDREARAELRGELMCQMETLMEYLHREFLMG